jgi:hypothetical protein
MCYCHYYDTPLPGNAEIYINELTKVVELSLINPDVIIRAWFNADFNKETTIIDKDAHISVWNDVKLYLSLIVIFSFVVLSMLVISLVKCVRGALKDGLTIIKSKFMWDYSIQFFYMAYIKLCMTVMNQIDLSSRNSYYWKAVDSDWAIVIGVILVGTPVAAFTFLWKSENLENEQVKQKYSNLYSDAALSRSNLSKYYSVAFAIRRIVFISIPVIFSDPMIQVMSFMLFHSLYVVTYAGIQPHTDSKRTSMEIFNEVILMIFLYHMAGWNGLILDL